MSDLTGNTDTTVSINTPPTLPPPSTIGFLNPDTNQKKVGRSKGSSSQAARIVLEDTELLKNEISMEWTQRVNNLSEGRQMKKNELDELINKKSKEHKLADIIISKSLIRQRVKRNKAICQPHSGTKTPMAPVEKYIVSLMEQMAKMQQPQNISEGLSLANSLIEGTEHRMGGCCCQVQM
jgi:hypothetical protein